MIADDPVVTIAHTLVSSPGVMAILIGSGVSRSAEIPTGWDVTLALMRELATLRGDEPEPDPARWFETTFGVTPDYSAVLDRLAQTPEGRRDVLERFLEPTDDDREQGKKRPTEAHRAIASIMRRGLVKVVLTTNFDRLLEQALSDVGVTPVVIASNDDATAAEPLVHQRHVVIKLNGDYKDPRIRNTASELACYDPHMASWLDRALTEFGLIVCGWSGEWDAALRAGFDRSSGCRYGTYWCSVGSVSSRAQEVIAKRSATVVPIVDADAFFGRLLEAVESLEDLRMQRPSSVAMATATLKRLLAEDSNRIRLVDFFQGEVRQASKSAQDAIPHDQYPSESLIASTVGRLDSELAIIVAVFFNGSRFGMGDEQRRLVKESLHLLVPAGQRLGQTYAVWSIMRLYAALCALYAAALGALLSSDWRFLRDLLTLEFSFDGRIVQAFGEVAIEMVLRDPVGRALRPGRKMGASEHLRDKLRPLVEGLVPDPDDLLNRLEVWLALAALETVKGDRGWAPPGRYMLLKSLTGVGQPDTLFAEAERDGAPWPPLQAGWFHGDAARFRDVASMLRDTVSHSGQMFW